MTKDPNFPLDGTLRHTKETHFFSFVEMSVSTRDFCFRFLPIVTLVNVLHVFFYKNERDCLLELDQYASEGFFGAGWSKNEI